MAQALTKQKQKKEPPTTANAKTKVRAVKFGSVRVPNEIPVTMQVAQKAERHDLCVLCLAKGADVPRPGLHDGCPDPMHIKYIRRLTRWARRVAIQATPHIRQQELHSYKRRYAKRRK